MQESQGQEWAPSDIQEQTSNQVLSVERLQVWFDVNIRLAPDFAVAAAIVVAVATTISVAELP